LANLGRDKKLDIRWLDCIAQEIELLKGLNLDDDFITKNKALKEPNNIDILIFSQSKMGLMIANKVNLRAIYF